MVSGPYDMVQHPGTAGAAGAMTAAKDMQNVRNGGELNAGA